LGLGAGSWGLGPGARKRRVCRDLRALDSFVVLLVCSIVFDSWFLVLAPVVLLLFGFWFLVLAPLYSYTKLHSIIQNKAQSVFL
jgi:hypothetical protein